MIPIRGSVRGTSIPVVTIGLIVVNVLVFIIQVSLPTWELTHLVHRWGLVPAREIVSFREAAQAIEYWMVPIFTSMFLHGGWMHLIGNMLFLWVFGDGVENRLGSGWFALFYMVGGVAASQAQVLANPGTLQPMIGASGAIAAVLGAYLILYPWARITVLFPVLFWPLFFEVPALFFLGFWFFEQIWLGTLGALSPIAGAAGGIAWWAHAGGFAAGALMISFLPRRPHPGIRKKPRVIRFYY